MKLSFTIALTSMSLPWSLSLFKYCEQIKSRITMANAAFNKKKSLFTSTMSFNLRNKLLKCYIWSISFYCAETWTLWRAEQKCLDIFEMCY